MDLSLQHSLVIRIKIIIKKITDHDESLNVAKRLGAAEINSDLKHAV